MADSLNVYHDGKERNLMDWIKEKGKRIYTDIGIKTWRVPPVRFNRQNLTEQKLAKLENDQQNIRIEGPVLGQTPETEQETNRAESYVCGVFENLSNYFVEQSLGSAMFIVTNFEYDCYLNKISNFIMETQQLGGKEIQAKSAHGKNGVVGDSSPVVKLPKDVAKRGELDVLILHQTAGVILVQTKAVGYNFLDNSTEFQRGDSVFTAVEKACKQLIRDRIVMLHIMNDLGLNEKQITSVVALPNLPRNILMKLISPELVNKIGSEFNLDLDDHFLCEEDLKPDINGCQTELARWWRDVLLKTAVGISLETMQQIAYRTVGLLSTVSLWSYAQPRIEVRNRNEAAWETGNRYTQVVLSAQQVGILKHDDQYLYIWGPAGSGKTLLLSLKGRQWLRQGYNVAIVNTRLGSRGRTVGQVIEATINKTEGLEKKVVRIDLDLMDNEETLLTIVNEQVKGQVYKFLLDEIAWVEETEKLLRLLKNSNKSSDIWCAGMLIECMPEGFVQRELEVILRCPPSVQRVLRIVDSRNKRCELYKLDSAKAGLPTDGLRPFFIIHSRHGDSSTQPYDCPICAQELSKFLINELNMKTTAENEQTANQESSNTPNQKCSQSDSSTQNAKEDICTDQSEYEKTTADKLSTSVGSDSGYDGGCTCTDIPNPSDIPDIKNTTIQQGHQPTINPRSKANKKPKKKKAKSTTSSDSQSIDKTDSISPSTQNSHITPSNFNKSHIANFYAHSTKENTNINPNDKSQNNEYQDSSAKKPGKQTTKKKGKKNASNTDQENQECSKEIHDDRHSATSGSNSSRKGNKNKKTGNMGDNKATYPIMNFRDCVLPVTVPRAWHHFNKRGHWSISREALAQEMVLLGSRAFCEELYYSQVPLKVEEAMVMKADGKELENNFVMCPLGAVHGLEYKLVVCVPSACDLPDYIEISEEIRHGKMEPKKKMKRTQFGANYLKNEDKRSCAEYILATTGGKFAPEIDKIRISTHVAEADAEYDMLYEPLAEGDNFISSQPEAVSANPYIAKSYTDEEIMKIKADLCGQCNDRDKCVCQYFKFEELAAIHRLDDWNRAYVLMCASRCTSVLVLVLP